MSQIALFVGSVRSDRKGIHVARWIEKKLQDRNHHVSFIDPKELDLPILDKMYKEIKEPNEKLLSLHSKVANAEGYIAITPEYNHSTSSALKNTLDYFLEEYFFKPSAIVSYSVGSFGGILAAQHLRQIFAELGTPSIPSAFLIPNVADVFDQDTGKLIDENYEKRVTKFLNEFEWFVDAFGNQRKRESHTKNMHSFE